MAKPQVRPKGVNEKPEDVPNCDCGYSRSDWMPHHDKECAYERHGQFHALKKGAHYVMGDLKP